MYCYSSINLETGTGRVAESFLSPLVSDPNITLSSETSYDSRISQWLRSQDAMGHAIGDWNNDGKLDWFSTAIMDDKKKCRHAGCTFDSEGNRLYQNLGLRQFDDITSKVKLYSLYPTNV